MTQRQQGGQITQIESLVHTPKAFGVLALDEQSLIASPELPVNSRIITVSDSSVILFILARTSGPAITESVLTPARHPGNVGINSSSCPRGKRELLLLKYGGRKCP